MRTTVVIPSEFLEVAEILGHDPARVALGAESSYLEVPSLGQARRVLSRASSEQHARRLPTFFQPNLELRRALGQGQHDRGEAVLFAGATEIDEDLRGRARHLPLHVKAVSVATKTVAAGEVWDLSVRGAQWGLDDLEELYVVANVGTLILEPGAAVIIRGNVFSLLCQRLVCDPLVDGGAGFHIGILPTPFSVDRRHGSQHGEAAAPGRPGCRGTDGRAPATSSSILGPILVGDPEPRERDGGPGGPGWVGAPGKPGRNGGMCKLAEITVRAIDGGPLALFAQPGDGGDGGRGGDGGAGGAGGSGGDGARTLTAVVSRGAGGHGGAGGDGGDGGAGGHGGIASNIYLTVPPDHADSVRCTALPSLPGRGGAAGAAGQGGSGGFAGRHPSDVEGRAAGRAGASGRPGRVGRPGRPRGAPVVFVNDRVRSTAAPTRQRSIDTPRLERDHV